ncbi:hypothetical protein N9N28_04815 [Rubripirellula amarantea]|nr:hypothetical protein [Rubripirellula amarantea]
MATRLNVGPLIVWEPPNTSHPKQLGQLSYHPRVERLSQSFGQIPNTAHPEQLGQLFYRPNVERLSQSFGDRPAEPEPKWNIWCHALSVQSNVAESGWHDIDSACWVAPFREPHADTGP